MTFQALRLACASLIIASLGTLACDDGFLASFPTIEVTPNPVFMPPVRAGETVEKALEVRNTGGGELVVTEITFSNTLDSREFRVSELRWQTNDGADQVVELQGSKDRIW